jgi:hypothetical protein
MGWLAAKLGKLFLLFGGLSALALVIGVVSYVFGEREFLVIGEQGERASFGTFAWQFGAIWIGSWLLWRLCVAFVFRYGDERAMASALGLESDYDEAEASRHRESGPLVACCRACGEEFRSKDDALDHADYVHGHDKLPEEARALLEWL